MHLEDKISDMMQLYNVLQAGVLVRKHQMCEHSPVSQIIHE